MEILLSVTVIADEGIELDHDAVITDLRLYLFEFAGYADDIPDVQGGFHIHRVTG